MGYGYAADTLNIDTPGGTVTLDPNYDCATDRVEITISDDDTAFDANQIGTVSDMDGNAIASGLIYGETFHAISDGTTTIWIEVVEVEGQVVGYLVSAPLDPGVAYTISTIKDVDAEFGTTIAYSTLFSAPCFGPGTHLMTTQGEVPIEWLTAGDKLITRDGGAQPILWIGRYRVSAANARLQPDLAPLQIAQDALGPGHPTHPTQLSSQHRVLLSGCDIELHTGSDEALAAVTHLEDGGLFARTTPARDFSYAHILLERHEVVLANGLWTETLFLGEHADQALLDLIPLAILNRPGLRKGHRNAARICLKRYEVSAVLGYHAQDSLPNLLRATG